MGKYTSLIHKAETPKLQEGGKEDRVNIHNVNINNIHNNTDIVIDTPLSSRP